MHYNKIIIMQAKHKKLKNLTNRSSVQVSPIQMCNFLFKKAIPVSQFTSTTNNNKCKHHNESLHLRFKSQISQDKILNQSFNLKTASNSRTVKVASLDLTCRVLKWNHLKNKKQKFIDKNAKSISFPKKLSENFQENILNRSNRVRINYKKPGLPSMSPPHINACKKGRFDTLRLSDNYKQTKRIVFIEQLQQKKDKQRMIYHHETKRLKSEVNPKNLQLEEKTKFEVRPSVMCRPWSGESTHSIH